MWPLKKVGIPKHFTQKDFSSENDLPVGNVNFRKFQSQKFVNSDIFWLEKYFNPETFCSTFLYLEVVSIGGGHLH